MPVTRRAFFRTLFAASQTAFVGKLLSGSLRADESTAGALNFAIIGDWGRRGRPDQVEVAKQMAIACRNAAATFVVSVGDNFYEDGVASLDDPHWQQSFERVYADPALQVPWYVILDNHDYHVDPQPQLDYARTHPRWVMPARSYIQHHVVDSATNLDCFYIDTSPMIREYRTDAKMAPHVATQDVSAQLAWLDASLASSRAPWKFVIGHHPIYSAGFGHGSQEEMIQLVLPLLQKHKVQAYFAGHDHDLQHLKGGDVHLFISGGGSEHRPVMSIPEAQFGAGISGFALASVRADEMTVRFIDNTGRLLHTAKVPRNTSMI
jgi:tartrate-resistant acid phosphatase type 5